MRRAKVSIALAVCLSVTAAGAVAAAPDKGCSNGDFTSIELNLTWQPGEPIPGPGEDAWWDLTLAGFATEGETPGSIADAFGFGSVAELYEAVALGIRAVDANGDGAICWKTFPDTSNGKAAYIFNVVDGNAAQH
jgi:hypothetical protein